MHNFIEKSVVSITDDSRVTISTQQIADILDIRHSDFVRLVERSNLCYQNAVAIECIDAENDGNVVVAYRLTRRGFMRATRKLIGPEMSDLRHRINRAFLDFTVQDPYENKIQTLLHRVRAAVLG